MAPESGNIDIGTRNRDLNMDSDYDFGSPDVQTMNYDSTNRNLEIVIIGE